MDATADAPAQEASTDAEARLLAEALDMPASALAAISREPLGAGTVAGFAVASGASTELPEGTVAYLDTSLLPVARETGLALDGVARVWIHPADPHLPALAPAAFGDAAGVLLSRLGIAATAPPAIVGYRPGRRAVLRVPTEAGAVWVKVVRPSRIERVAAAHTALRQQGLPVPAVHGWSPEGLLVLADADGAPATEMTWHPERLLDAVDLLRDRLAGVELAWPARTSLAARLPWYLARLEAAMPLRAERIRDVGVRLENTLRSAPASVATVHGDLHIGQLFVVGDALTGLIDVDTAGRGDAAGDTAAFLGHAVTSALLTEAQWSRGEAQWSRREAQGRRAEPLRALAAGAWARWGDDRRVRALTAVHLLGHALGAAAAGDAPRAVLLLEAAERAAAEHKRPLMAPFEAP